jgi:hypothetical protein
MYAEPEVGAKRIGSVPAGVILEALQETERYGGYVKVTYKKKTGFIFKAEVQRYMDVPAPELACWSNGYKIIGYIGITLFSVMMELLRIREILPLGYSTEMTK